MTAPLTETLETTLQHYDGSQAREEIERFRKMPSLLDAIRVAAESKEESGAPYSHQYKIFNRWPNAIPEATPILTAAQDQFRSCADFAEIHDLVKKLVADVEGLGDLYWYDVAFRIGAYLNLYPTKVYLHAGPLKAAKRLGLPYKKRYLDVWELPEILRKKEPWEVEDILCKYENRCEKLEKRLKANAK